MLTRLRTELLFCLDFPASSNLAEFDSSAKREAVRHHPDRQNRASKASQPDFKLNTKFKKKTYLISFYCEVIKLNIYHNLFKIVHNMSGTLLFN